MTIAAFGFAAALTPSLLPHPITFVLLLTSLGTMAGYAVGTTATWALRKIPVIKRWQPPRWLVITVPAVAWLLALFFMPIAISWQVAQQDRLAMPETLPSSLVILGGTLVVATLLLLLGRSIRSLSNAIAGAIGRIPFIRSRVESGAHPTRRVAGLRAGVAILAIIVGFIAIQGLLSLLITSYDSVNADTTGQSPDNLGINSGSPDSYAPWDTLGRQGRAYVGNTMTPTAISGITGKPAEQPVRVYVGMQQGSTPDARTELAVRELDRVDAWSRDYLVLFGVTGTGWVDPNAINALEAVTDGKVTTVAVQYSAVPSWIGFVVDPQTTVDQNSSMIDGVLAAWREKPANSRPELILFGQSLGALGTQGAWTPTSTPEEVTSEIPHIAWIGPPAESVLWSAWQTNRTGGPAWQPVIGDGTIAKVLVTSAEGLDLATKAPPTIVFSAHANDPVVYWTPSLLFSKPEWLEPPLGPGVMPQMRWFPIITFLQVGMDLISGGEPPEVGHNYSANMAAAVAAAVNPEGWTVEKTLLLQEHLPSLLYPTG